MSGRIRSSESLQAVLGRLAGDYRRTVSYYGNLEARPGFSRTPRRLLSDVGFPATTQFTYLVPARSHVEMNEDTRAVTRVTFCPYGVIEDRQRIRSTRESDRRVRTASTSGAGGMRTYAADARYLVSSELDDNTYAEAKTVRLVRRIVTASAGPAYHVVINRRGDVIVAAALDDTTRAAGENADVSVDVALESALAVLQTEHAERQFGSIAELPFTAPQIAAIAALIGKLRAAYPTLTARILPAETSGAGFSYQWPDATEDVTPKNLSNGAWVNRSPFDHTYSDAPRLFTLAEERGSFDLASEVFRNADSPPARTGRSEAQTAVSYADTAGAESVLLGAYSSIAGEERASEMQGTPRRRIFVERIHMAHHDAATAGESAGHVATASEPAAPSPAQNTGPHIFDFTTGLWGDGGSY